MPWFWKEFWEEEVVLAGSFCNKARIQAPGEAASRRLHHEWAACNKRFNRKDAKIAKKAGAAELIWDALEGVPEENRAYRESGRGMMDENLATAWALVSAWSLS
jgi:hypothetical protein